MSVRVAMCARLLSCRHYLPDPAVSFGQQVELAGRVNPNAEVNPVSGTIGVGEPGNID